MHCEVCGKKIKKFYLVLIEGTQLRTCRECAKFGTELRSQRKPKVVRKKVGKPRIEFEVVEGYHKLLRATREKLRLSREEFGKKINEKASVIARLESGKMVPNLKLARKIESTFRIKLLEKVEEGKVSATTSSYRELTIGDVIRIRKRK